MPLSLPALKRIHVSFPILRLIPFPSLRIILLLSLANILIWIAAGIVLHFHPSLSSSAVLAYTLGLRHALDADHISAIDLTTRQLLALSRKDKHGNARPVVSVGMWFSLGHSTIVVITTILVAATTAGITSHFDAFSSVGGVVGSSVSAGFLLVLGGINGWLLWKGIGNLRRIVGEERMGRLGGDGGRPAGQVKESGANTSHEEKEHYVVVAMAGSGQDAERIQDARKIPDEEEELKLRNRSCLNALLRWSLKLIDRPWKIYPLGVLFGLGFDTSSEIALLGITTLESSRGMADADTSDPGAGTLPTSAIWAILVFPLLFTAGMCLLDTIDGALMYALYTSRAAGTSQLAVAYANVVLTGFTVLVAVGVGILQMLNMLSNVLPQWRMDESPGFWDGVAAIGGRYDVVGGIVCAGFVVVGGIAWVMYRPWRTAVIVEKRIDMTER